jgi:hypothetical protein
MKKDKQQDTSCGTSGCTQQFLPWSQWFCSHYDSGCCDSDFPNMFVQKNNCCRMKQFMDGDCKENGNYPFQGNKEQETGKKEACTSVDLNVCIHF